MENIKKIIFVSSFIFFICSTAQGAGFYFNVSNEVHVGEEFELGILLNTGEETINSVETSVSYDSNYFEFKGYNENNGLIKVWIEKPNDNNGLITLSGIVPGGVSGVFDPLKDSIENVPIASLKFRAKSSPGALFEIDRAQVLKHDGFGTELSVNKNSVYVSVVEIFKNGISEELVQKTDNVPPLPFEIIFKESNENAGIPSIIIFETTDEDSGIKEYQIKTDSLGFRKAKSPEVIRKGIFPKSVVVRAFDFEGNYRDESIVISGIIPTYFAVLVLLFLVVSGVFVFKLIK